MDHIWFFSFCRIRHKLLFPYHYFRKFLITCNPVLDEIFFGNCCIPYTDRVPEIISKNLFYLFGILFDKCTAKFLQCLSIFSWDIRKPLSDLLYKKIPDLSVWNYQMVFSTFCTAFVYQISCGSIDWSYLSWSI